jgi:signal transduction histidine kinase
MGLAFRSPRPFPPREISLLEALGHQIGVAVENARLVQQVAQLAILEERSRIGMDLHDGVIQSIYAVGLTLEAAGLVINQEPHKAAGMLRQGIDGLNDAIRDIRNFILDLRPRRFEGDLRQGLARLAREFQANTMIEVSLDAPEHGLEGLPRPVAQAIFLTAQEALANVARHAKAARVGVAVEPSDTIVELTIADDGQGFDPDTRTQTVGHGLANMRDRAAELNGRFELRSAPGKGTTIKMTLPLPGG